MFVLPQESRINVRSESGLWLPRRDAQECGLPLDTGYIVGGSTAARGEFPFLVLLGYQNQGKSNEILYRCGASLINRKYVLTAAHCHNPSNPEDQIIEVVRKKHN